LRKESFEEGKVFSVVYYMYGVYGVVRLWSCVCVCVLRAARFSPDRQYLLFIIIIRRSSSMIIIIFYFLKNNYY
jgi:hypothetical protein